MKARLSLADEPCGVARRAGSPGVIREITGMTRDFWTNAVLVWLVTASVAVALVVLHLLRHKKLFLAPSFSGQFAWSCATSWCLGSGNTAAVRCAIFASTLGGSDHSRTIGTSTLGVNSGLVGRPDRRASVLGDGLDSYCGHTALPEFSFLFLLALSYDPFRSAVNGNANALAAVNVIAALTAIETLIPWLMALYHWGTRNPARSGRRRLWGRLLIFTLFIGAWAYWLSDASSARSVRGAVRAI